MCILGLKVEAKTLAEVVLTRPASKVKSTLQKMLEIAADLQLTPSAGWRGAMEEVDKLEQDKVEGSRMHSDVLMVLEQVSSVRTKWLRNASVGSRYRADFYDESTKTVVDLDTLARPMNRFLKHKHLKQQGYKPVAVEYWRFRSASRSQESQKTFFTELLSQAKV
jgi:hypothetical protein